VAGSGSASRPHRVDLSIADFAIAVPARHSLWPVAGSVFFVTPYWRPSRSTPAAAEDKTHKEGIRPDLVLIASTTPPVAP